VSEFIGIGIVVALILAFFMMLSSGTAYWWWRERHVDEDAHLHLGGPGNGDWAFLCADCEFESKGWESQSAAAERGKQHYREHRTGRVNTHG
jgi:hypothetical protein